MANPPKLPLTELQKRRNARRTIAVGTTVVLAGAGWIMWSYMNPQQHTQLPVPKIAKSDDIYATQAPPKPAAPAPLGDLMITPPELSMGTVVIGKENSTRSVSIRAKDAKAKITKVFLPYAQQSGFKIDTSQCLNIDMDADGACPIAVIFDPSRAGSVRSAIQIEAILLRTDGSPRSLNLQIPLDANAEEPPKQPVAPSIGADASSPYSMDDLAYLSRRRRPGLLDLQFDPGGATYMNPQDPRMENWRTIGYGQNMSTYPVDMRRVVTMDKPIPAVIKLPIDSRHPSRAVATVERDIYGGDGNTVVIERGSTLIGTAASVGNPAEEKMGISWERLMRPDGSAWQLSATSGDAMGRSGVIGFNDDRWFERFGVTLAASAMVAGLDIAINASQNTTVTGFSTTTETKPAFVAAQQFNGDFKSIFQQFAKERLSIQPIRTIPVGTRVTIFPTTDLWLRPVVPNSDMRAAYAQKVVGSQDYVAAQQRALSAQKATGIGLPNASAAAAQPQAGQSAIPQPAAVGTADRLSTLGQQGPAASLPPINSLPAVTLDGTATAAGGQAGFATAPTAYEQYIKANPNPVAPQTQSPLGANAYPNQLSYPQGYPTPATGGGWLR
ncbi:MAG TPA: TrbI/VirB10 family protein [Beijerinckiaceae bacterium]|mgnify:CR=1 FL=1|nr:TrbI/VirB10 family protein [Rhodoblastus sp.]MCB1533378.1 TrbI/VirB10 family protein [Rhodoblastus sp.]MCC2106099.1 TrbI/VirB10 family protein [Hyphomicrobiales bacterium]HRY01652.1 TrbI/VirB10 family protein [Beijerinckiaceae bacterium]